jgi:hypothetical protein
MKALSVSYRGLPNRTGQNSKSLRLKPIVIPPNGVKEMNFKNSSRRSNAQLQKGNISSWRLKNQNRSHPCSISAKPFGGSLAHDGGVPLESKRMQYKTNTVKAQ